MKPHKPQNPEQSELFRSRLDSQINMNHELVRLSALIDWTVFDDRFSELYHAEVGCPGKPTRLMVGLLYLKHLHKLSMSNWSLAGRKICTGSTFAARVTFRPTGRLIRAP